MGGCVSEGTEARGFIFTLLMYWRSRPSRVALCSVRLLPDIQVAWELHIFKQSIKSTSLLQLNIMWQIPVAPGIEKQVFPLIFPLCTTVLDLGFCPILWEAIWPAPKPAPLPRSESRRLMQVFYFEKTIDFYCSFLQEIAEFLTVDIPRLQRVLLLQCSQNKLVYNNIPVTYLGENVLG